MDSFSKIGPKVLLCCVAAIFVFHAAGCNHTQDVAVPVKMSEYIKLSTSQKRDLPSRTVLLLNIQRVTDQQLPAKDRIYSFSMVRKFYQDEPMLREGLAAIVDKPKTPYRLSKTVKNFLLTLPPTFPDMKEQPIAKAPQIPPKENRR